MARNTELQMELRNSVAAMEQMIESQQRIERIQRSLTYLRDLHSRMVSEKINKILYMSNKSSIEFPSSSNYHCFILHLG